MTQVSESDKWCTGDSSAWVHVTHLKASQGDSLKGVKKLNNDNKEKYYPLRVFEHSTFSSKALHATTRLRRLTGGYQYKYMNEMCWYTLYVYTDDNNENIKC